MEQVGARRVRIRVTATNDRTTPVAWRVHSNTRVRPDGWVPAEPEAHLDFLDRLALRRP
jgi:hypothetical protein